MTFLTPSAKRDAISHSLLITSLHAAIEDDFHRASPGHYIDLISLTAVHEYATKACIAQSLQPLTLFVAAREAC